MQIFTETLCLLKSVEVYLVSEVSYKVRFFEYLQRLVFIPVKFLKMGAGEKMKGTSLWSVLTLISLTGGLWITNSLGISRTEAGNFVFLLSVVAPMFLVVFALPSMFGQSGVSLIDVQFVVEHLRTRGFGNLKDIDLLKSSVKIFEVRVRTRVSALKWLVGILWAIYIYVLTKGIDTPMSDSSLYISNLYTSAGLLILVIMAYVLVWGYEAGIDKLFRTIEFGCNDFCYRVE